MDEGKRRREFWVGGLKKHIDFGLECFRIGLNS